MARDLIPTDPRRSGEDAPESDASQRPSGLPPQNRLALLRANLKLTQEDVAAGIGVSPQTIHRWENRKVRIPVAAEAKLAAFFGVSVDALYREPTPLRRVPILYLSSWRQFRPDADLAPETELWAWVQTGPEYEERELAATILGDDALAGRGLCRGTRAFFAPLEPGEPIHPGEAYLVRRDREGEALVAVGIARVAPDGSRWFVADAEDPTYLPIPEHGGREAPTRVVGRVVAFSTVLP